MALSLLFAICFSSFFSKEKDSYSANRPTSFTFSTNPRKLYTLSSYDEPIKSSNAFSRALKRFSKAGQDPVDQKQWYYVYIYGDISKVQKYVNLRIDDQVIKNTFILYLSETQISQISPHSLVKQIEPSDKIDLLKQYNETDYFRVETAQDYELSTMNDLFSIEKSDGNKYVIKVEQRNLKSAQFIQKKKQVVHLLSEIPAVKLISTYNQPVLQNYVSIGYAQKHDQKPHRDENTNYLILPRYMHEKGLTGEGQIITIEDSPIDFRHPMFRDENVQVEFNKDMPNHRKILFYQSYTDMNGWEENLTANEHGTHTAGTLAGKSIIKEDGSNSNSKLFDGAAPDAKIVYAGLYGNITGAQLEEAMNSHNSRISSNSWGDSDKYVDSLNHEYGLLAYKNPQSIFLFAAGNYAIAGDYTVIDPSGSKNVLSVTGTTNPIVQNKQEFAIQSESDKSILIFCKGVFDATMNEFEIHSDFLGIEKEKGAEIIAIKYEPDESGSYNNVCSMLNGNHTSLLYGPDLSDMTNFIDFCPVEFSHGMLITTDVANVEKLLENNGKIKATLNGNTEEILKIQKGSYASIGPANKGMMKPDVAVPGTTVVSSRSYVVTDEPYSCNDISEGCGLVIKDGTSMATPIAAGNAALVAQYFKTGKWIDSTDLDGATMRALLINSCIHPEDKKQPDVYLGHGVIDLSTILPFDNAFGVQIPHQDRETFVTEYGHVTAKVEVKSNKADLQVTLSYLDVMLEESSPIPLTRDLDLVVVDPDGQVFYGDHLENNDSQHFSTNEKVIVRKDEIKVGTYTVHVYGNKFLDSAITKEALKQSFSCVATGDIDNKYIEFVESAEAPCEEADPQHPGYCKCKENELGPLCQVKVVEVEQPEVLNNYTVQQHDILRLHFKTDKVIEGVELYVDAGIFHTAAWISPKCHLAPHEYESHVKFPIYIPEEYNISFGTKELCVAIFGNSNTPFDYHIQLLTNDDENEPTKEPIDPTKEPVDPTKEPVDPTKEPVDPTKEPIDPTKEPVDPTKEPIDPTKEPIAPTNEPTKDDGADDNNDNNNKSKNKTKTILIVVAILLACIAVGGIVAAVVIFLRMKKGREGIELLQSENAASTEPLRSPLLF